MRYHGRMSDCRYGSGDVIYARDLQRLMSQDCIIERGAMITLFYDDADRGVFVGSGSGEGSETLTAPIASGNDAKHNAATEIAMEETAVHGSGVAAPLAAQPIASVEQPTALPLDVNALVKATGGNGSIAVILALIAVLFGAAGWRFWTRISDQHHEIKMKELELRAASGTSNSPQQCTTVHAAFEARIAALEGKVAVVEKSALSLGDGFDPEDFDKRMDKIERQLKLAKQRKAG